MEAWEEAVYDGIEPELLANAAFFAALSMDCDHRHPTVATSSKLVISCCSGRFSGL
jgi:hypothetical protein